MPRLLVAQIRRKSRGHNLGRWLTKRDVVLARDRAALHFDGEGALLALPAVSRRLGPASPEELRRLAHAAWKMARATSRYRGVSRDDRRGGWCATIKVFYKNLAIGHFTSERAAASAYDEAALFYFGRRATLNFPSRRTAPRSLEEIRRALALAKKRRHKNRYRGVAKKHDQRRVFAYQAELRHGNRKLVLAQWRTAREAAIAHDRAALFYHRERSWLNFPELRKKLVAASAEELRNESRRVFKAQTWSRFRGVTLDRRNGRWVARITREGTGHHLGYFDSEEEAAEAHDRAARRLHRNAKLNFDPVTGQELLWGASKPSRSVPRRRVERSQG